MVSKQKKSALKSAQSEEQKRQETKRLAQEKAIYSLPSTFALITAQRLLAKLGINLSQDSISVQIIQPKTYYHALLYAPAKRTMLQGAIERCRDIQAYGQQKLIHYLFSGEASKEEEETGGEMRTQIEASRLKLVELGQKFVEWEEKCINRTEDILDELFERAQSWQRTVHAVLVDLSEYLQTNGVPLTQVFLEYAQTHLLECSASLILTNELQVKYACPPDFGIIEKTVICLLEQESLAGAIDANKLNEMRPFFKELDLRLQSDFDSLSGYNGGAKVEAEEDNKQMDMFTLSFEQEIVKVSQMLYKYYTGYASDKALQVDVEQAVKFGVDESVADDYIALHR